MPPERTTEDGPARTFRVGIHAAGPLALGPGSWAGVSTARLAEALAGPGAGAEVVLVVGPADRDAAAALADRGGGRLRYFVAGHPETVSLPAPPGGVFRRVLAWARRAGAAGDLLRARRRQLRAGARAALARRLRTFRALAGRRRAVVWPAVGLGLLLTPVALPLLWGLYATYRLGASLVRGLCFPLRVLERAVQRLSPPLPTPAPPPAGPEQVLGLMYQAACDVWLLPWGGCYPEIPFPTVVLVGDDLLSRAGNQAGAPDAPVPRLPAHVARAALLVNPSPGRPSREVAEQALPESALVRVVRPVPPADRAGAVHALEWVAVFKEAVEVADWWRWFDRKLMAPWPRCGAVPAQPLRELEAFLFLQSAYAGGVWQTTKELIADLVEINRGRGRLNLTVGLHDAQEDTGPVERLGDRLALRWVRLNPITRGEVVRMVGGTPPWLLARPEREFSFLSGAAASALRADAWLALVDRFPLPLLPARPYGVVVYDVIQRHNPAGFPPPFPRNMAAGMAPTARHADIIVVTSPQTRDDVIAEYRVDPTRVRLVPVACNPHRRFGHLVPAHVPGAQEPFILNVTSCAEHKGPDVMLRGYARLKDRLGRSAPRLVVCGWATDAFAPGYAGPCGLPLGEAMRRLVNDLGLEVGRDVAFLGFVSHEGLADLYRRCAVVVNAALCDNGSFTLTEAAYFGRPAVSAGYAAARYLCERFDVPAVFFPAGDPEALAEAVLAALQQPPPGPAEVAESRARFNHPEFSSRRYAERIYDALVALAEQGRRTRLPESLRAGA